MEQPGDILLETGQRLPLPAEAVRKRREFGTPTLLATDAFFSPQFESSPNPRPMLHPNTSLLTRRRFLENSALIAACAFVPQKTEAQSGENPAMQKVTARQTGRTQRGPILRYYVPPEAREEHLAELITTCERVGVSEVSLFTTEYLGTSQFKEIDELKKI